MTEETKQVEQWPEVTLGRWKAEDGLPPGPLWAGSTGPVGDFGDADAKWETERYYPANAPNVLSEEEARLVALALKSWAGPKEDDLQALRQRLSDWAGDQS